MISFIVVTIEGFFADCECSLDCKRISAIDGSCGEVFVDMVHSQYDSCDVGGTS